MMNEVIFDRKKYNSYKDFYVQIYKDLDGKSIPDWAESNNLDYSADQLNEFLWYCHNDNTKYVFVNFDKEKIKLAKNLNDFKFNIILRVFERFVSRYPNNTMEYRFDEEEK